MAESECNISKKNGTNCSRKFVAMSVTTISHPTPSMFQDSSGQRIEPCSDACCMPSYRRQINPTSSICRSFVLGMLRRASKEFMCEEQHP